ncbi:MAG: hypothetical protein MJ252_14300 [archaeon]|nr:hypothetical protein [archaeon]
MKTKLTLSKKSTIKTLCIRKKRILTIGAIDLNLTLKLTNDFLMTHSIEFKSIKTIKDLYFLSEDTNLWDKITLSSDKKSLNTLLYINKTQRKKALIEYINIGSYELTSEADFLKQMVRSLLKTNYICLTSNINDNSPSSNICLTVINEDNASNAKKEKDIIKNFYLTACSKKNRNNSTKSNSANEEKNSNPQNEEEKDQRSQEENNFNETEKSTDINPLIVPSIEYQDFDFAYFDLDELIPKLNSAFSYKHLNHFIENLKTSSPCDIAVSFPSTPFKFDEESIRLFLKIIYCADLIFFTEEFLYKFLNVLFIIKRNNKSRQKLERKKMYDFFAEEIITKSKYSFKRKSCVIYEGFKNVIFLEAFHSGKFQIFTYESTLLPKINHGNFLLLSEYKKELETNSDLYLGVFSGAIIGRLFKSSIESKNFYTAFIYGIETTKKVLEILKNGFEIPQTKDFFILDIPTEQLRYLKKTEQNTDREKHFVLDCLNKKSSSMDHYDPLKDQHLNLYFASNFNRKNMENQGLIDENGYILELPKIRKETAERTKSNSPEKKPKKVILNKNKSSKQFMRTIKQLELWKEPQNRNLNVMQAFKNSPVPTKQKITYSNVDNVLGKKKVTKNNRLRPIYARNKSTLSFHTHFSS